VTQQSKPTTSTTSTTSPTSAKKESGKSSHEIEKEINTTRGAITDDIRALSDKFSPANIKEEAKNAAKDAVTTVKQAASDKASEVKDNVIEKAQEIKEVVADKAVALKESATEKASELKDEASEKLAEARDAIVETYDEVSEQAIRIGGEAWRYTAANAVPLAMVGVGAGWLIANARSSSKLSVDYDEFDEYDDELDWGDPSARTRPRASRAVAPVRRSAQRPRARASGVANQAGSLAKQARSAARNATHKIEDSASQGAQAIKRGAAQSGALVRESFDRAASATRTFATENPIALAVATLVAGVGIGMLLPASEREARLLTPARQKIDSWLGDAREAASDVANVAKQATRDTLHAS